MKMKKHFFLPVFAMFVVAPAFSEAGDFQKSPPDFVVKETVLDSSLKKNEAAFVFKFKVNDFAATDSIQFSDNGKAAKLKPDQTGMVMLKVKPGKHKFQFFLNSFFFEIYTDSVEVKPRYRTTADVRFQSARYEVISDKPVIYVYPEQTKQISVQLDVKGTLGFSYPQYNGGWNFTADPDGTIRMNGKQYDYLFWDGATTVNLSTTKLQDGFLVRKNELIPFFEDKLTAMGLSPREINDFITYWCPRMQANETSFVHFEFNAGYEAVSSMQITPKPDNLFRMYMTWGNASGLHDVAFTPQPLEKVTRSGFTVVEWGGTELKKFPQELVFTK
jgi:hypothetical protein